MIQFYFQINYLMHATLSAYDTVQLYFQMNSLMYAKLRTIENSFKMNSLIYCMHHDGLMIQNNFKILYILYILYAPRKTYDIVQLPNELPIVCNTEVENPCTFFVLYIHEILLTYVYVA